MSPVFCFGLWVVTLPVGYYASGLFFPEELLITRIQVFIWASVAWLVFLETFGPGLEFSRGDKYYSEDDDIYYPPVPEGMILPFEPRQRKRNAQ